MGPSAAQRSSESCSPGSPAFLSSRFLYLEVEDTSNTLLLHEPKKERGARYE